MMNKPTFEFEVHLKPYPNQHEHDYTLMDLSNLEIRPLAGDGGGKMLCLWPTVEAYLSDEYSIKVPLTFSSTLHDELDRIEHPDGKVEVRWTFHRQAATVIIHDILRVAARMELAPA